MLDPNHDGKAAKHAQRCDQGGDVHTFDESGTCFECDAKQSAGDYCKARGLSVAEVGRMVGKPRQTLINWHRESPDLFRVVVAGVIAVKLERC